MAFASSPRPFGAHTVIGTLLMVFGSGAWSKSPITSDTRYGTWRFSCTQCQTSRSPFTSCEASAPLELAWKPFGTSTVSSVGIRTFGKSWIGNQ